MKPTFDVCFSEEHPDRPGLWIQRRKDSKFIGILDVQQSDVERDAREGNWLDGEWAAELKLVARDVVPLQKKKVQEHIDRLINRFNDERLDLKIHLDEMTSATGGETTDDKVMHEWSKSEHRLCRAEAAIDCLQDLRQSLLGEKLVLPPDDADAEKTDTD